MQGQGQRRERSPESFSEEYWNDINDDERRAFIDQIEDEYFAILNDYVKHANLAVNHFRTISESHRSWRKRLILATGVLAIINTTAALHLVGGIPSVESEVALAEVLAAVAAIYAVGLTIAYNLENFFNLGEKATGFRESRDILVTAYRTHRERWTEFVGIKGVSTPRACVNAALIYRELVEADEEVRSKIKNLTEVEDKTSGGGNT